MNYYIVVEGKCGESIVYPEWIGILSPELNKVSSLDELNGQSYYLISGNGYPNYLTIIDNAVLDIIDYGTIDRLVIGVDAEDWSVSEKRQQIVDVIGGRLRPDQYRIVIQNPCLESWALGNRVVCKRNPGDAKLREYLRLYDVRAEDPELLPSLEVDRYNRAQFAFRYLKKILNDRHPSLTYTKHNPRIICHPTYFQRLQERLSDTGHISSFNEFLDCFTA